MLGARLIGSFDGLGLTSVTKTGSGTLSCGTISATTSCSIGALGNTGNISAKPTLEKVSSAVVANAGVPVTVTQTVTNEIFPGAVGSPYSTTIDTGASATTSAFTLTGSGAGWISVMKMTATVNGVSYTLSLTGSGA